MDDALLVRGLERVGDLPRDRAPRPTEAARGDPLRERVALDQFQNERANAVAPRHRRMAPMCG